uniref:DNA repair protein REV1 n=1 Tax=Nothobranchius kadleci TaxID=1051664 RepID=A0A1A8E4X0_NOTKA
MAGRLLPYFQYQLYTKQKSTLFPGVILHRSSTATGSGHLPLQTSARQKLRSPQRNTELSVPHSERSLSSCQNNSILVSTRIEADPLSTLHSGRARSVNPRPNQLTTDLLTHNQCSTKHSHPAHLHEEDLKINGRLQTSVDNTSHSKINKLQECTEDDFCSFGVNEAPLTNGHAHLVNGALKSGDLSSGTDPNYRIGSKSKVQRSTDKPQSPLKQNKCDPYEFPPSPPKLDASPDGHRTPPPACPESPKANKTQLPPKRTSAPRSIKSCILHVDMDCFFVSVGIRHRPDLKGKPVAVTSNRGQGRVPLRPGANPQAEQQYYQRKHTHPQPDEDLLGTPSQGWPNSCDSRAETDAAALSMAEIASCSYEARQVGVRNGMFFGKAKQLCPSLQAVSYDFEAYKEVALNMYEILASYTRDIEALSCDEALVDASALLAEVGVGPEDLARAIRADIEKKTGCCASVGMGSNILLARLATRKAKPNGQYFLKSEEVDDFIRDLPVTSLPGVGRAMAKKLAGMEVTSCGDLQHVTLSQLQKRFGPRTGQTLFRFCRGLDDRPVRFEKERKSVSAEMNYNIRFTTVDETESFLTSLSTEVQRRLQEAGLRGRRVTLKVMVRKAGAPLEPAKYGGHGICDHLAKTVMLAQSTDSGQLIASAVIKLFHAMKLQVQDLRGVGIQVQLLEGNQSVARDSRVPQSHSIKDLLLGPGPSAKPGNKDALQDQPSRSSAPSRGSPPNLRASPEPVPGTSKDFPGCRQTPKHSHSHLNVSIEVPSPSQVDRSVLEALPAELREQVERSWSRRDDRPNNCHPADLQPSSPNPRSTSPPHPALYSPPAGTLLLQIPNQPDSPGIVLELPNFSQVDPDVFAALPKELQEELKSAYHRAANLPPQVNAAAVEQKNPLLQLKQPGAGAGVGPAKRRYKRKNVVSPVKKGTSPVKRQQGTHSPTKTASRPVRSQELMNVPKTENEPSTSKQDIPAPVTDPVPRPVPALAGACELTDIKTLLREWVTTTTDPKEEDILHVVKYCTDLVEDKDLERLDLVIKCMKRLMQQSVESIWSTAFDFILDIVQVVVQQAYGSILKIT